MHTLRNIINVRGLLDRKVYVVVSKVMLGERRVSHYAFNRVMYSRTLYGGLQSAVRGSALSLASGSRVKRFTHYAS